MPIFNKAIVNQYLANFNKEELDKSFKKFNDNFNYKKIEKIKKLKEEEYQDGFTRDLFVDVLGYILHPDENSTCIFDF